MARARSPQDPPPTGNLRARFIPLAESRMAAVLTAMDYLADLSVRNRYHYTDEEWDVMYGALSDKLKELDERFRNGKGNKPVFSFHKKE